VEIREDRSYIFKDKVKGVGGMPMGSQGKMVSLISGGIDSPVATWLMMKRGCEIIPVYFENGEYGGEDYTLRAIEGIKKLKDWSPGHPMKVYRVPHGESLKKFKEAGNERYTCVFCKRLMYKAAVEIAKKEGAHGIVTGSSLGQVASQTSDNLMIEHLGIDFPIYHPLIGMDKTEIVALARQIGSLDISISPASSCKAVPRHPAIHGRPDEVEKMGVDLKLEELVADDLSRAIVETI
jgi:tRNA uracil 4-sulfurtransferase